MGYIDETFGKITEILLKLFKKKNESYGNSFMSMNRVSMRNEILRKVRRYENLFKDDDSSSSLVGNKELIIPTMVDLANYAIMAIMREIGEDSIFCESKIKNILANLECDILTCKEEIKINYATPHTITVKYLEKNDNKEEK